MNYKAFVSGLFLSLTVVFLSVGLSAQPMDTEKGRKYLEQIEKYLPAMMAKKPETEYQWKGFDEALLRKNAASLEQNIEPYTKKAGAKPTAVATDEVYVRRIYLDLAGRIPTLDEARSFLESKNSDKRERLVFTLLKSDDYAGNFFNYWSSLLRIPSFIQGMPPKAYENWVKGVLKNNLPYDEWVRRMVTARGAATEDNGAVGFIVRDRETGILDAMSETSQVFLGSQIGCAMCHNAKFEKWKQREFYALTAYFSEVQMFKDPKKALEIYGSMKGKTTEEVRKLQREFRELPFIVYDKKGKELDLPVNYAYEPKDAGKPIKPAVLYGNAPVAKEGDSRREIFARWLTSPDNPNFTKTIANRLWGKVYGIALVEPVNDMSDGNPPRSSEILDFATELMKTLQYDMKSYLAVLFLTKTYQLDSSEAGFNPEKYAFDSHPLRRMRAEELRDSITVASSGRAFSNIPAISAKMGSISSTDLQSRIEVNAFGKTADQTAMEKKTVEEMQAGMKKMSEGNSMRGGYGNGILACDQFLPVRAGTFMDQFGASRREVVTEGSVEANISQVLTLMNGQEVERLVQPGPRNALYEILRESKDNPPEMIKNLFLSLYARHPDEAEGKIIAEHLSKNPAKAFTDVVWALVNNREFYFVR